VTRLTLYGRPGCHLCDEARDVILALREEGLRFDLDEVDIETDDGLLRAFVERIPVVTVNDEIVSELVIDRVALRTRLDTVGT
jgi:hypothetical protein